MNLKKETLYNILKLLLAILLVFFIAKKGLLNFSDFKNFILNYKVITAAIIIFPLHFLFFTLRWKLIIERWAVVNFSLAYKLNYVGLFFSFFLPGGVSGDLIKGLELAKATKLSKTEATNTALVDRILGLLFLMLFATVFLCFAVYTLGETKATPYLIAAALLTLGLVCFLAIIVYSNKYFVRLSQRKWHPWLKKGFHFIDTLNALLLKTLNLRLLVLSFFYSLAAQILSVGFIYFICSTIGPVPISFSLFFPLACFGFLASAIPITPAGIGVGQAAFFYLYSHWSPALASSVTSAILVFQFFYFIFGLIGGILFLKRRILSHDPTHQTTH